MNRFEILGHQIGFSEKRTNAAEGMRMDCSQCALCAENPNLSLSCEDGLRVSFGVATCGSANTTLRKEDDTWQSVQGTRPGASISSLREGGVVVRYDEEGLLTNAQYRITPSLRQQLLARIGIDRVLWNPEDL